MLDRIWCVRRNYRLLVLSPPPSIVWFRNDLRLADNPAVQAAVNEDAPIIALYILEETKAQRPLGGASRWWLDKSLKALSADIAERGGNLTLRRGDPKSIIEELVNDTGAASVFWNRRYGEADRHIDKAIKSCLKDRGVDTISFNGSLLTEPWQIETNSGGHYKVFTPYWKSVRACYQAPNPIPAPTQISCVRVDSDKVESWGLHPTSPDWSEGFNAPWVPGESGARNRLDDFLKNSVSCYEDDRNRPDKDCGTSGLSPHLRFGEISPVSVWRATLARIEDGSLDEASAYVFLSEIVWREFSYVLLFHYPDLHEENYNADFAHMPWRSSKSDYDRWCRGQTGYPIVDAGMRQLWATGWMHNRVRMIVASFLTKHLLLPWQKGEDWFWDTLVDADPASNAASWQWTAGSGADAAPYFRVFNPITQGQKFDETGNYVRKWVPELADLPTKHIHEPWAAPQKILDEACVTLGSTYPHPMIEHKEGRQRALDAYDTLKEKRDAA